MSASDLVLVNDVSVTADDKQSTMTREEYAAELWGMKIDYVDVEEHVLELGEIDC